MVKLAKSLAGKSEKDINEALRHKYLDATERLSVKLEIQAQSQQRRITAALATDVAEYRIDQRPMNETQRMLLKAGFRLGQRYGEMDVDRLLQESELDPTQKIACRLELRDLGMVAAAEATALQRTLQASAEKRPVLLKDERGRPRTLIGYSW
jgi:hypothetical protein